MLDMTCDRCPVSRTCPESGSSPLMEGARRYCCRIVGGFGRTPVDPSVLSKESAILSAKDGPCLTIAEIPFREDGVVEYKVVKVFSPPVLSDRERPGAMLGGMLDPKSPGIR